MGLHVLAVNGMLVREARSYILRCHGCFKCVAASLPVPVLVPVPVPAGDSPEASSIPYVLSFHLCASLWPTHCLYHTEIPGAEAASDLSLTHKCEGPRVKGCVFWSRDHSDDMH